MPKTSIVTIGKIIRQVARLRGGGSALPGLVVEKIDPEFVKDTLSQLPMGVVVISGTNGKTTTTKIVVDLLESQGLRVFTNRTGSNFVRGVIAALLGEINTRGELNADIAVLELDEAHAVKFVDTVQPKYSLLLNVLRDQLDRFGEVDVAAKFLTHIASKTSDIVVLNREDPNIVSAEKNISPEAKAVFFGLSEELKHKFVTEDSMDINDDISRANKPTKAMLKKISGSTTTISLDGVDSDLKLNLSGIYNIYNAVAALALVQEILADSCDKDMLLKTVSEVKPAFGRGESLTIDNQKLDLILVKNPSGFRLALESFSPDNVATMIAINDEYADGRDMSWLWDVNFDSLQSNGVSHIGGIRAYDMALRLDSSDITFKTIKTDLAAALDSFLRTNPDSPKRIYCTYTAMVRLRKLLSTKTSVEEVS